METAYFGLVSIGIAAIIFWALKYDDQSEFDGQKRDTKFSPTKAKSEDPGQGGDELAG